MGAHLSKVSVILHGSLFAYATKSQSLTEVWLHLRVCKTSATKGSVSSDIDSCCEEWPKAPIPRATFEEICDVCEVKHPSASGSSCEHIHTEAYGVRVVSGHYDSDTCSANVVKGTSGDPHYICFPSCDPFSKTDCKRFWTRWRKPIENEKSHDESDEEDETEKEHQNEKHEAAVLDIRDDEAEKEVHKETNELSKKVSKKSRDQSDEEDQTDKKHLSEKSEAAVLETEDTEAEKEDQKETKKVSTKTSKNSHDESDEEDETERTQSEKNEDAVSETEDTKADKEDQKETKKVSSKASKNSHDKSDEEDEAERTQSEKNEDAVSEAEDTEAEKEDQKETKKVSTKASKDSHDKSVEEDETERTQSEKNEAVVSETEDTEAEEKDQKETKKVSTKTSKNSHDQSDEEDETERTQSEKNEAAGSEIEDTKPDKEDQKENSVSDKIRNALKDAETVLISTVENDAESAWKEVTNPKKFEKDFERAAKKVEKGAESAWKEVTNPKKLEKDSKLTAKEVAKESRVVAKNMSSFGATIYSIARTDVLSLMRKHTVFFSALVACGTLCAVVSVLIFFGIVEVSTVVDVGTAGLMVLDVGSDVYVARKYYIHAVDEGDFPIFFTISLCILLISSTFGLAYVLVFEDLPDSWKDFYKAFDKNVFEPIRKSKSQTVGEALVILLHVVIFIMMIPLGSVLPIVTYLLGRFCTEGKEKQLKDKIDAAKKDLNRLKQHTKLFGLRLNEEEGKLAPRMTRVNELSVGMSDKIGLIYSRKTEDLQSSSYTLLLQELEENADAISLRGEIETQTTATQFEVERLSREYYDAMYIDRGSYDDKRSKLMAKQNELEAQRTQLQLLLANQHGVFKSVGIGCWVSGFHVQQCIEISKKLVESETRYSGGGIFDFLQRLRNPESPEYLKKQLAAVKEAEKETLMAKCTNMRKVPVMIPIDVEYEPVEGKPGKPPERFDLTPEDAVVQEEIVARFVSQVQPAIESGQAELDEFQNTLSQVVVERGKTAAEFLTKLGEIEDNPAEEETIRDEMKSKLDEIDGILQSMRAVIWEKQTAVRHLKIESQRWEKVLTERRDKEAERLRGAEYDASFKNDEVLFLEIQHKMKTHLPFYVETILESIPQSLTQTSALVIYGHSTGVSYVSIFSIATSIASIMSKVYVLCISKIKWVFVYKLLCGCHDIALMFYTISALFQMRHGDEDGVQLWFMTRPVDFWSSIWLWQSFILGSEIWIVGMVCSTIPLGLFFKTRYNDLSRSRPDLEGMVKVLCLVVAPVLAWLLFVFIATVFLMLPIMVVLQAVRLLFSLAYVTIFDYAMSDGPGSEMLVFVTSAFEFVIGKAKTEKTNALTMLHWLANNDGEPTDLEMENIHKPVSSYQKIKNAFSFVYGRLRRIFALIPAGLRLLDDLRKHGEELSGQRYWEEFWKKVLALLAGIAGVIIFVTWYLGLVYSLLYPILSYSVALQSYVYEDKELNAFQSFLFLLYEGFLISVIVVQLRVHNNYLAVLAVAVDIDVLLDALLEDYKESVSSGEAKEELSKAKDATQQRMKKISERLTRHGKEGLEGFDRMFEKYFCKRAGENFKTKNNSRSCTKLCCCSLGADASDEHEYTLLGQDEEESLVLEGGRENDDKTVTFTFKPGPIGIMHEPQSCFVGKVNDGGQCHKASVRAGWSIVAINGQKCTSFNDDVFMKAKAGSTDYQITFSKADLFDIMDTDKDGIVTRVEYEKATVNITFKPGPIGILYEPKGCVVGSVDESGQAFRAGVKVGWAIIAVDGRTCKSFGDDVFLKAKNGSVDYNVTFTKSGLNISDQLFIEDEALKRSMDWRVGTFAEFHDITQEKSKSSAKVRRVPSGTVLNGIREGDWLRLSDGSGYTLICDGSITFLELEIEVQPQLQPQPQPQGWRVVTTLVIWKEKSESTDKVRHLNPGEVVYGHPEGDWVRLSDGSGYFLIREGSTIPVQTQPQPKDPDTILVQPQPQPQPYEPPTIPVKPRVEPPVQPQPKDPDLEAPSFGDEVETLPGVTLVIDGKEYYAPSDRGRVSHDSYIDDKDGIARIKVTWYRTGLTSTMKVDKWQHNFKATGNSIKVPSVGDELEALPGHDFSKDDVEYHRGGDRGRMCKDPHKDDKGHERFDIIWYRTGKVSTMRVDDWIRSFMHVGFGMTFPSLGDRLEALPGITFCDEGDLIYYEPGDKGIVSKDVYVGSDGIEFVEILWHRTGQTSKMKKDDMLQNVCLVRKKMEAPSFGDEVETLPGVSLVIDGKEYYGPSDRGRVSHDSYIDDKDGVAKIKVTWYRTGLTSTMKVDKWQHNFKATGNSIKVPSLGDELEALPGNDFVKDDVEYHRGGDRGTMCKAVHKDDKDRDIFDVKWHRTGKVSTKAVESWIRGFMYIGTAKDLFFGDEVETLPEVSLVIDGKEYYGPSDRGRVSHASYIDDKDGVARIKVTWYRTGLTSTMKVDKWQKNFKATGNSIKVPSLGDELEALPGHDFSMDDVEYHRGRDLGRMCKDVHKDDKGDERFDVKWYRTGKVSTMKVDDWIRSFRHIGQQAPTCGDEVEALPGKRFVGRGKREYYTPGDKGIVCKEIDTSKADGIDRFAVKWDRTALTSTERRDTWMRRFWLQVNPEVLSQPGLKSDKSQPGLRLEQASATEVLREPIIGIDVARGPHWRYGSQDGGAGFIGTTVDSGPDGCQPGWVRVLWQTGYEDIYRIGADGYYDLIFVKASRETGSGTKEFLLEWKDWKEQLGNVEAVIESFADKNGFSIGKFQAVPYDSSGKKHEIAKLPKDESLWPIKFVFSDKQEGARRSSAASSRSPKRRAEKESAQVRVIVLKATGLRNADSEDGTLSDPFCALHVREEGRPVPKYVFKTKHIDDTLNPEWKQSFDFKYEKGDTLNFSVWDKDWGKQTDDFLGKVTMVKDQFFPHGGDFDLVLEGTGKNVSNLFVKIEIL